MSFLIILFCCFIFCQLNGRVKTYRQVYAILHDCIFWDRKPFHVNRPCRPPGSVSPTLPEWESYKGCPEVLMSGYWRLSRPLVFFWGESNYVHTFSMDLRWHLSLSGTRGGIRGCFVSGIRRRLIVFRGSGDLVFISGWRRFSFRPR